MGEKDDLVQCGRCRFSICAANLVRIATTAMCAVLILVLQTGVSGADEWSLTPSVQLRNQYDDNIFLSVDDPVSTWGGSLSPLIDLRKRTTTGFLGIGARLIFNRYATDEIRDTNIQLLTISGRSATQLSRYNLTGSYRRDTTIATVSAAPEDDDEEDGQAVDAPDVDAGLVETQVRRNRLSLRPSWTYSLARLTSLRLSYSLNSTNYSDDAGTSLEDYRRYRISAAITHRLTQGDQLSVNVGAGTYKSPDRGSETDDYSLSVGLSHNYSPLLRGNVTVGVRSSTTTFNDVEDDSTGGSLTASLVKKSTELTTYRFQAGRNLYPSGAGTLVLSDHLQARVLHQISPVLSFSLFANVQKNSSPDFFSGSVDRLYYDIEPGFRYLLTRLWSIDGSYRYRWQEYEDRADSADSNAVFVAINYAWPRLAVSR
ncbi:MAG: outer membrane beta-barrel protein [Gammaproteobacteria bacterium]|nr:outer membrane beta-barrel protein [Gammaproteobacteria bacterium]